eukprot:14360813-Ditylum_brightwellii.AAC.1
MLWSVHHLWPAAAVFAFITYCHWRKLVLRSHDNLVLSKEGGTQGDHLAMILYSLAGLPLILHIKETISTPDDIISQLQKCFADDSAIGAFSRP